MKSLQISNFICVTDVTQLFPLYVAKMFLISPLFVLNFFNCPDLIEAVGPYPNAPNLPKYFSFYPKPEWPF